MYLPVAPDRSNRMKGLTRRERLDRCYRGLETDRPGVYLRGVTDLSPADPSYEPLRKLAWLHTELKDHWSAWSLMPPQELDSRIEAHTDAFDRRITVLHTPAGELFRSEFVGRQKQPGMTEKYLLESPKDAERYLSLPAPEPSGELEGFFQTVARMGDRGIVEVGLGFNPAGAVAELFGTENFAIMSVEHRGVLHELMRRRMETTLRLIEHVVARGGGPYFAMLGEEYIVPPIHGPKDFRDFNLRYDKPIVDLVHEAGGLIHIHCHGSLKTVLDCFAEIGPDVLHPVEGPPMGDVTPADAKRILGEGVCLEGNIQIADMIEGQTESVRQQVRALLRDVWLPNRRGLIVAPTASPYLAKMTRLMLENYRALVQSARSALE